MILKLFNFYIVLPCNAQVRDSYCKNGGMCKHSDDSDDSDATCECDCLPEFRGEICDETGSLIYYVKHRDSLVTSLTDKQLLFDLFHFFKS